MLHAEKKKIYNTSLATKQYWLARSLASRRPPPKKTPCRSSKVIQRRQNAKPVQAAVPDQFELKGICMTVATLKKQGPAPPHFASLGVEGPGTFSASSIRNTSELIESCSPPTIMSSSDLDPPSRSKCPSLFAAKILDCFLYIK